MPAMTSTPGLTQPPPGPVVPERVLVRRLRFEEIGELAEAIRGETSRAQIENRWREQELGYRELLAAEVDGRLVGTVSIGERPGPPGRSLHLFALEVAREWRNRGIGGQVVRWVVEEAQRRGLRRVFLEVRTDNPARRLYHRLGFRRVGAPFINAWWRYGEDGSRERMEEPSYRMVKRLPR